MQHSKIELVMSHKQLGLVIGMMLLLIGAAVFGTRDFVIHQQAQQSAQVITDQNRTFLFAVDPGTRKVLTYSVVPGDVKLVGDGFKSVAGKSASTITGKQAAVIIVSNDAGSVQQTIAGRKALPRLVWKDAEHLFQQQFFKQGQIVYLSDQPLKYDDEYVLVEQPVADTSR